MSLNIGKGWHYESHRHSLARKGIKTGRKSRAGTLDHSKILDFPKGRGNDYHTAITVPSTTQADKPVSREEHKKRAEEVERFLSEKFGGYTEISGGGGWVSDEKGLIKEPVYVVHSYTDKKHWLAQDRNVDLFVRRKKREWGQESIAIQFRDSMHFV